MEEMYKNILSMISSLTHLSETTYEFKKEPSEAKAIEIVEIVNKSENKFLKVKEDLVKMIQDVDNSEELEIEAVKTGSGFLIKEQ